MGILSRFKDIVASNVNALLDRAEDPAKMVDQYLRKMAADLAQVKSETAGVMAEESRTKRLVDENVREVSKYQDLAKRALVAGNEEDAKIFLKKKQETEAIGAGLHMSYAVAHENAIKMRQMHDKLVRDINTLNQKRQAIKAKVAVARTQDRINAIGAETDKAGGAQGAFARMEEKANRMLDEANARAELDSQPVDEAIALEEKYKSADTDESVADELAVMKTQLGLN
ncbi:MAG: PspA/IM30 family protein [Defluviitaleaceae bacterium]|nr:PspA/IM30 family protein [Defluviitaleaceae bacterium]